MPSTVEVNNLAKQYRDGDATTVVFTDLSFTVDAGVSMALTGPSGSGKSTLLNVLAGLLTADEGEVILRSSSGVIAVHKLDARARTRMRRRHVGYVHQFFNLVPTLTVLENISLPAVLNGIGDATERALRLLKDFGLDTHVDKFPEDLSGGEQQRVAVARAMVHDPDLLLADEPTGNLDAVNSEHVSEQLFAAARERGIALIVATHNEQMAARADEWLRLDLQDNVGG